MEASSEVAGLGDVRQGTQAEAAAWDGKGGSGRAVELRVFEGNIKPMPEPPVAAQLEHLKSVLANLMETVEGFAIEREAYRNVALEHNATWPELDEAVQAAMNDPETRARIREQYKEMRDAIENVSLAVFLLVDLPQTGQPN